MTNLPEEKVLYSEIQKKLFFIIPEKWESIFLYASIIDVPNQKPVGEMYFYYLPKGILRKKYVNGYEIPSIFNIDEEQYSKLITDVYNLVKLLRERAIAKNKKKVWSNINITIKNFQFKIEFDYENLRQSPFDSYERHVIWRYNYLNEDIDTMSRKDKKIIEHYEQYKQTEIPIKKDVYIEGVYKQPVKNIIDFEKTLTVDEAVAQSKKESEVREKKKKGFFNKNKIDDVIDEDDENQTFNNQILNWKK